jgi:hypothetical protein
MLVGVDDSGTPMAFVKLGEAEHILMSFPKRKYTDVRRALWPRCQRVDDTRFCHKGWATRPPAQKYRRVADAALGAQAAAADTAFPCYVGHIRYSPNDIRWRNNVP